MLIKKIYNRKFLIITPLSFVVVVSVLFLINRDSNYISYSPNKETCQKLTDRGQKETCWQSLLENTLNKNGLEVGFELFREIAQIQPEDCHSYAHNLGEYAFKAYSRGKKIQISQEASYCGYGFWHGFTAKMIVNSNINQAIQFCRSLSTPGLLLEQAHDNCAHGIGIGLIPDPPPYQFWGKAQPLIDTALKSCDTISDGGSMRDTCHSGVFHAIITFMNQKLYKFDFDKNNPFELCLAQREKYRAECYYQVAPKLAALTRKNLNLTYQLIKKISDHPIFEHTFMIAMINFIDQKMANDDYVNFLSRCQSLNDNLSNLCISSVINSLFNTGIPGKEYDKAIGFCRAKSLSYNDRPTCFENVIAASKRFYSQNKLLEVCDIIEKNYKKVCP